MVSLPLSDSVSSVLHPHQVTDPVTHPVSHGVQEPWWWRKRPPDDCHQDTGLAPAVSSGGDMGHMVLMVSVALRSP